MPGTWGWWKSHIYSLLGMDQVLPDFSAYGGPWFLVPETHELSEIEAEDLLTAVRERLCVDLNRTTINVSGAYRALASLRNDDGLPLLFAMRHVARDGAYVGNYWPFLATALFTESYTENHLKVLRIDLVEGFTNAWFRLWEFSGRTLFFPPYGPRHIKWPLAHAGLLKGDEVVLARFGSFLYTNVTDFEGQDLLNPEHVDEFGELLRSWLRHSGAGSNVAARVFDPNFFDTAAALAQRWVREHWGQTVAGPVLSVSLIRTEMKLDLANGHVAIVIPETRWPASVDTGRVRFGEQTSAGQLQTILDNGETYVLWRTITLQVGAPPWPTDIVMEGGYRVLHIPTPTDASGQSLVFDARSGRLVRRWELGEQYYTLIPTRYLGASDTTSQADLFAVQERLASPIGWDNYTLFWVQTRTFNSGTSVTDDIADTTRLEEATEALHLPSFAHHWKPRISLIGGRVLDQSGSEPCYGVGDPPLLEVRGKWQGSLNLRVLRNSSPPMPYTLVDSLSLSYESTHGKAIVELWGQNTALVAGRYRIEANRMSPLMFFLSPDGDESVLRQHFSLTFAVLDESGRNLAGIFERQDLAAGILHIHAWPYAHLFMDLRVGIWVRRISVQTDIQGIWRVRWRDLGIGGIPAGPLRIGVAWRGLAREELDFVDGPYIEPESILIGSSCPTEVTGKVVGPTTGSCVRVVIVGDRPWDGMCWQRIVPLDPVTRTFHVEFEDAVVAKACWLIVLPGDADDSDDTRPLLIKDLRRHAEASCDE